MILLDRDEKTVYDSGSYDPFSEEYKNSWKLISPKSGPDLIYHYICVDKTKTESTIDSTEKQTDEEILPEPIKIDSIKKSDGFEVKKIRWAKHEDYERVVIDIFKGDKPVEKPTNYNVSEEEGKNRLRVEFKDYNKFSAEIPDLKDSGFISKIYNENDRKDQTKNNFVIVIDLKKQVEYKSFELENPGRIVIDLNDD